MRVKLDVGSVFERVFAAYRDQAGLLIPAALAVFVPIAIANAIVLATDSALAVVGASLLGLVGAYWFQGMVVEATRDILDGRRDHTLGSLFSSVSPVVGPLLVVGVLAGIGIGIGFVLLIVPGLLLLTWWAVVAPVVVVERPGVLPAFGRSRALVRGSGWQVFGVIVVLFLLQLVLTGLLRTIALALSDSAPATAGADLVVNVFVAPLSALAATIMFFELKRLRGESVPGRGDPWSGGAGGATLPPVQAMPRSEESPPLSEPVPAQPGEPVPSEPPPPGKPPAPPGPGGPQAPPER